MENIQTVTRREVVASTERVDNLAAADRRYDISGEAIIRGKVMEKINSGRVCRKEGGAEIAQFNTWGERTLGITCNDAPTDEVADIAADIAGFVTALKANVAAAE